MIGSRFSGGEVDWLSAEAKYANRSIEATIVINELLAMAREYRLAGEKAAALGLTPVEEAFYDSIANNLSAQELMGDEVLMAMARELAQKLRNIISIDGNTKTTCGQDCAR